MARKIAILLLIFITFYLGAHYWIRWRNTVSDDVSKISRLVECDPNDIKGLKITRIPKGEENILTFTRSDIPRQGLSSSAQLSFSEWKFMSPLMGEADAGMMIRFSTMFCEIYDPAPAPADHFVAGSLPVDKITFDLQGGNAPGEHSLSFGRVAEDRMSVVKYRSPGGEERILKIQPNILELASLAPLEFLNRKVMRMSADNVIVASVFDGQKEKFTLEREGDGWRMLNGGKSLGKGSEEATKYVNRLTTLKALKVNAEALSPASCESASSQMRIQLLGVGDRRETLYFQFGKTGPLSVCNSAREALFTVHRDLLPYLETPVKNLVANP